MTMTILRTDQVFCRMPTIKMYLLRLNDSTGIMGYWEQTTEANCHFITTYQRYIWSTWFIAADVDFDHLVEVVFIRFFLCKVILLLSFTLCFRRGTLRRVHISETRIYIPTPWGRSIYINNLEIFCTRNLFLPKSYLGEVSKQ